MPLHWVRGTVPGLLARTRSEKDERVPAERLAPTVRRGCSFYVIQQWIPCFKYKEMR